MATTETTHRTLDSNEAEVKRLLDRDWQLLVGGERIPASGGRTYEVISPYLEEAIAEAPDGSSDDVALAVNAAHAAAPAWGRIPAPERATLLSRLADEIESRAYEFALLDSINGGAPVGVMLGDVAFGVEALRYFAGIAREAKGYTVPASANFHYTEMQPFGVVAKIIPFNHPFLFASSKIAAPLAAGNTVVLKPAEVTPLSALMLGDLLAEFLPPGVANIVVGNGPDVPRALVRHPVVRRIGFTGSEAVGRSIQRDAAEIGVKTVTLELGGKNALVACADASPDDVARGIIQGMNFTWSGQSCASTSRLLVHEDIADEVLKSVQERLRARRYLSPLDPDAEQGTMVNRRQYERALGYIDRAVEQGATVVAGGGRPASAERGLFIEPTFLDGLGPDWPVATEEIFGPVVSVLRWRTEEEAIQIANSVDYGLSGSIFTNDIRAGHRMARNLDAGYVWINTAGPHYFGLPFGGWKNSGIGREECIEELLSYTQSKSVTVML